MSDQSPSETCPLLAAELNFDVYARFSRAQKSVILVLVSFCGLIPFFVSGTFIPLIPDIANDLGVTGSVVSLAVSLSMLAVSIGALPGAAYSTFYGRRPVYLVGIPLFVIGSFGVGFSKDIIQLLVWRFIQAVGAAPGMSVGASTIGDIYRLEERGQAIGVFLSACLLGPALAPPVGGFVAEYSSWRTMQFVLGVSGCGIFLCLALFLPETSHPNARGVDKIPENSSKLVFVNPLRPLALLRSPNIIAIAFTGFTVLLTQYILLVPLAYNIGARYNLENTALIGACFIPGGVGNMVGAPLAGRLSDRAIVQWRDRRGGVWYPEDRLRGTLLSAGIFVPLSVLFFGLTIQYVPGKVGLTLALVCLFLNGVGVDMVLSPCAAYVVDIMRGRSAEALASNVALRGTAVSILVAGILPLVNSIGVAWTNGLAALIACTGYLAMWCTIRYGGQMRNWVDVGYSTDGNTQP